MRISMRLRMRTEFRQGYGVISQLRSRTVNAECTCYRQSYERPNFLTDLESTPTKCVRASPKIKDPETLDYAIMIGMNWQL